MIGRTSKVVVEVLLATLLGLAVVLAAAGWRLSQGPVSLSFLTDEIETALNTPDAPLVFTLQDTNLAWGGWERTLDLRVVGVKLLAREDRRVVASVPEMAVSLSGTALLSGRLAPTTLEVIGAQVALERTADGAFRLAMGEGAGGGSGVAGANDFLGALLGVLSAQRDPDRPLTYLNRLSIIDSRITVVDRMTGTLWGAPKADVIVTRRDDGLHLHLASEIDLGRGRARLDGDVTWKTGAKDVSVDARVARLDPSLLAGKLPALARLSGLRLPMGGALTAKIGLNGMLHEASFRLRGGKGEVEAAEFWKQPVPVAGIQARGAFRRGPDMLDIESLEIDLGGPKITARGSAIRIGTTTALDATARLIDMPMKGLDRYWPINAAPPTRAWILGNIPDGRMTEARVKLAMHFEASDDTMSVDALNGTMVFKDATVSYLDGMPPVRRAHATAAFALDRFLFDFTKGELEGMRLDTGTARFTGLDTDSEQAAIEVVVRGSLGNALALIDRPRFGFSKKLGLNPKSVRGESATRLAISFPLLKDLKGEQVSIVAASNLRDVFLPGAVMGKPLIDGKLSLRVDLKGMEVKGTAKLGPTPAQISWFETFVGNPRFTRRYEVKGTLSEADRKAFDLPLADVVKGPVALDLALLERPGGAGVMEVKLGLKQGAVSAPAFGWQKPAGTDGLAWLTIDTHKHEPVAIRAFEVTIPGLHAKGSVRLKDGQGGIALTLDRLVQGATDLTGTVKRAANGALDIDIKGRGLDAAALFRHLTAGEDDGAPSPPVALKAKLDQFWFNTGEPIAAVDAVLDYDGRSVRRFDFKGAVSDKNSIAIAMGAEGGERRFSFKSDNAGRALQALGLTNNVRGGTLDLTATRKDREGKQPWRGTAKMNEYQLVNAPALARILTVASLTGINNLLTGQGIAFAGMELPFVFEKPVLRIENGRAIGSELGITANGTVNISSDVWNLEGTLVPAYTLNSLLGNIPILGRIFTGDKGSGIFAVTYRVRGKLEDPDAVSVNPLSALAPGFLRNVFGIFTGGGKPAEPAPPKNGG